MDYAMRKHGKPPKLAPWGAFLSSFLRGKGSRPRLIAVSSTVKPFAKIVADYPCHNGEKECLDYILHNASTSFPCRSGDGNEQSIA